MACENELSTMAQELSPGAPSAWATWHAHLIRPGARVLDLAAGRGRHALWAAGLGAKVVAIDHDAAKLEVGRRAAASRGLAGIEWVVADLERCAIPHAFDIVLIFNYLDRRRFGEFSAALKTGGYLIAETFLTRQRELGWGPTSDDHLLCPGELWRLVTPFELVFGREALEPVGQRFRAVASVVARRVVP